LCIDDLIANEHNRVVSPSSNILAQCRRFTNLSRRHRYPDNERTDCFMSDMIDHDHNTVDWSMRTNLDSCRNKQDTDRTRSMAIDVDDHIVELVQHVIDAVEQFNRTHPSDMNKLNESNTRQARLREFVKYAGHRGVRRPMLIETYLILSNIVFRYVS
jgi:hypothetical protein